MKKNLIMGIVASAALAMTGCSSDEAALTSAQNNAIEFGTYLGRDAQTRGTVMNSTNITDMGVYASYTGQADFATSDKPNFMFDQKVTKAGDAWGYSPVKYWPSTQGDKVSFFAYAPYKDGTIVKENSDNDAAGAPTLTVTLADDPKDMKDFVAGVQINKTFDNATSADNTVKFSLKHELSRVGISAKLDEEVYNGTGNKVKTFVVIKSVKIDNATDAQFYKSATYTFASANDDRGRWSTPAAATADWNLANVLNTSSITAANAVSGDYKTGVTGIKLTNGDVTNLFKSGEYLFFIPVVGTGLTDGKATATISYDIVTEDASLAAGYSVTSATKTVNLPTGTLQQGKAYTYTFVIKLNEVKLSATVEDWGTDANSDVDVPYNAHN